MIMKNPTNKDYNIQMFIFLAQVRTSNQTGLVQNGTANFFPFLPDVQTGT